MTNNDEQGTVLTLTDGFTSTGMQLKVLREALADFEKKTEKSLMEAVKYWTCAKHEHRLNAVGDLQRALRKRNGDGYRINP